MDKEKLLINDQELSIDVLSMFEALSADLTSRQVTLERSLTATQMLKGLLL